MTLSMLIWAAKGRGGLLAFMHARPVANEQDGAHLAWQVQQAERQAREEALYRLSAIGVPRR